MIIFECIDPLIFLIALCIGLFYTYITMPKPEIVYKYPTPFNAGKLVYVDKNNTCYKYRIDRVECPLDASKIKKYSYQ
jgi:hypothetical protein